MSAGFPGDFPDVDEARRTIERLKARRADGLACAAVLLVLLPLALVWHSEAVAALLIGAVAAICLLVNAHFELARCLERWASFVGMSRLPEVAECQARLVSAGRRHQLAARLRAVADTAAAPFDGTPRSTSTLVLVDRVAGVREQLLEVAAAVERVDHPDPVTIARLWQLLSDGARSPLYNPMVVAGELEVVLRQARWSLLMRE